MPKTYQEYIQGNKDIRKTNSEEIAGFLNILGQSQAHKLAMDLDVQMSTLPKAQRKAELDEQRGFFEEYDKVDPYRKLATEFVNIKLDGSKDSENSYNEVLNANMAFLDFIMKGDNFNKTMDMLLYGRGEEMRADAMNKYIAYLNMLNEEFGANIDIEAHREKFANYNQSLRSKQMAEDNGFEILDKNPEDDYTIPEAETALQKEFLDCARNYDNAKLFGRGSDAYRNCGTAYKALANQIDQLYKLQRTQNSGLPVNNEAIIQAINNVKAAAKQLKDTNNLYYDHKKADGQWGPNLRNKNAKRRIEAIQAMDKFADKLDKLMDRKLAELGIGAVEEEKADEADNSFDEELDKRLEEYRKNPRRAPRPMGAWKIISYDDWKEKCPTEGQVIFNAPEDAGNFSVVAEEFGNAVFSIKQNLKNGLKDPKSAEILKTLDELSELASPADELEKNKNFNVDDWERDINAKLKAVKDFFNADGNYSKFAEELDAIPEKDRFGSKNPHELLKDSLEKLNGMFDLGIDVNALENKYTNSKKNDINIDAPKQEAPKQDAPKEEAPKQEAPKQEGPKTYITFNQWEKKYPIDPRDLDDYDDEDDMDDFEVVLSEKESKELDAVYQQHRDLKSCEAFLGGLLTYSRSVKGGEDTEKLINQIWKLSGLSAAASTLKSGDGFDPRQWEEKVNGNINSMKELLNTGDNYAKIMTFTDEYDEQLKKDKIIGKVTSSQFIRNAINDINKLYNADIDLAALDKKYEDYKKNAVKVEVKEEPKKEQPKQEAPKPEVKAEPKKAEPKQEAPKPEVKEEPKNIINEEPKKDDLEKELIDDEGLINFINNKINENRKEAELDNFIEGEQKIIDSRGGMPEDDIINDKDDIGENIMNDNNDNIFNINNENNDFDIKNNAQELNIKSEPEPIVEKEDREFTEAMKQDREFLQSALKHKQQVGSYKGTDYMPLKHTLAKVITANIVSSKMNPSDWNFQKEVEYQAKQIEKQKPFNDLIAKANRTNNGLDELINKALSPNGTALKFDYLEMAKPKNLTNDNVKPNEMNLGIGIK